MKLKINKIHMKNFCGFEDKTIVFEGKNAKITGRNKAGKSTIKRSILWAFTGKDEYGSASFDVKPKNKDGSFKHKLETSVEIEFILINDKGSVTHTIRRVLNEVWGRPYGQEQEVLTSHKTTYFIDSVNKSEKEFNSILSAIAENIGLLLDIQHFARLNWKKQRDLLFLLTNEITKDDIYKKIPELETIFKDKNIIDIENIAKQELDKFKKEHAKIKALVEDAHANMSTVSEAEKAQIEATIKILETEIQNKTLLLHDLGSNNELLQKEKELSGLKQIKNAEYYKNLEIQKDTVMRLFQDKEGKKQELANLANKIKECNEKLIIKNTKIIELRLEFKNQNKLLTDLKNACPTCQQTLSEQFVLEQKDGLCPTCHRDLPIIEENPIFINLQKNIDDITNKGIKINKDIPIIEADKKKLEEEFTLLQNCHAKLDTTYWNAFSEIEKLNKVDPEDCLEIQDLIKEINSLKNQNDENRKIELSKEIEQKMKFLKDFKDKLDAAKLAIANSLKLEENKKRFETIGKEIVRQEVILDQVKLYNKTKAELDSEKINERFTNIQFQLFEMQLNGIPKEVCNLLIEGVDYWSANTAGRFYANKEIVEVFSKHFNCFLPVFIDGRESISDDIMIEGHQVIELIVEKSDIENENNTKELKIELKGN